MKNKILEKVETEENKYQEKCVFTSIDIFSGAFDYLSFYYICEICFNDFWFVSPYHCYFFVRSKFKKKNFVNVELPKGLAKEEDIKKRNETNNEGNVDEAIKFFQSEEVTQLFENVDFIYYEENEMNDTKKESYQVLIDVVNKCTISELKKMSHLFSENPMWLTNRQTWMEAIMRDKFRRNEKMRLNLGDTGIREIVYRVKDDAIENIRNRRMVKDYYFLGVLGNKGQNILGRIYMNIRNDISKNYEIYMWTLYSGRLQTDENLLPDICIEETYFEKVLTKEQNEGKLNKLIEETKKEFSDNFLYSDKNISVEKKIKNYTFEKKEYISFGKNEKNDIICFNPSISRFHCILYFCKDCYLYLMDVGSKARTKLNDVTCEINKKYKVRNNDIINLGVSKRTYKIQIKVNKILSYLNEQQEEINSKVQSIHQEIEQPKINKKLIKIKNIYYKCNENDLLDFFRDCGPIRKLKLFKVLDKTGMQEKNKKKNEEDANGEVNTEKRVGMEEKRVKKPKSTKEAIIELYDEETAENIMKKNDCFLYGNKINITYQPLQWNLHNENWRNREEAVRGEGDNRKRERYSNWKGKRRNVRDEVDQRRTDGQQTRQESRQENRQYIRKQHERQYERKYKEEYMREDKREKKRYKISPNRRRNSIQSIDESGYNKRKDRHKRNELKDTSMRKRRSISISSNSSKSTNERSKKYERHTRMNYKNDRNKKNKKRKQISTSKSREKSRSFSSVSSRNRS